MAANNETCDPAPLTSAAVITFVPAIQALLNGFVAVAAIRSRRKLENNFVYVNVASLLTANLAYGLFTFYTLLNKAIGFEHGGDSDDAVPHMVDHEKYFHAKLKMWWGFRSAFSLCVFLIMSANTSGLIYSLKEGSYSVGLALARDQSEQRNRMSLKTKRNRAIAIVLVSWLVPAVLSIIVATTWNCLDLCVCFDAYYMDRYVCDGDTNRHCSRVFEAVHNSFILSIVVAWFLLTTLLVATMIRTFLQYRRDSNRREKAETASCVPGTDDADRQLQDSSHAKQEMRIGQDFLSLSHLSYSMKCMVLISSLFVASTLPGVVILLVDVASEDYVLNAVVNTLGVVCVYVFGLASPAILVCYMYGLRQAVIDLLQAFSCCCTKTVVVRGARGSGDN